MKAYNCDPRYNAIIKLCCPGGAAVLERNRLMLDFASISKSLDDGTERRQLLVIADARVAGRLLVERRSGGPWSIHGLVACARSAR